MKNTRKQFLTIIAILLLMTSLCSCEFDESRNNFRGGELLDDERMSEIKNEVLATQNATESVTDNSDNDQSDESDIHSEWNTEEAGKDTEGTERNETEGSENTGGTAIFVYWTKSGSRWHLSTDCHYIKDKEVISGTEDEAIAAGMTSVCSSCSKTSS